MSGKRIDTSADRQPLTASPFAALAGASGIPEPAVPQKPSPQPQEGKKPKAPYGIGRTRKGGMPISVEHRPGGKVVTVIRNVSGDAEALLKQLKQKCGAGGAIREGAIEIQGDHCDRFTALLKDLLK